MCQIIIFLSEFDSDRILNEGGYDIIFFILKIILIYIVISKCIKLKNINYIKYIFSSLFAIYIIHQLLFGSITGHTISNAFTILGISIFFVINKIDIKLQNKIVRYIFYNENSSCCQCCNP